MQRVDKLAEKSALDAAALQDHLKQSLGLGKSARLVPFGSSKRTATVTQSSSFSRSAAPSSVSSSRTSTASSASLSVAGRRAPTTLERSPVRLSKLEPDRVLVELGESRECDACGTTCQLANSICSHCGHRLPKVQEREGRRPAPSLAQQRGLVPGPAPMLTATDWAGVEARAAARGDSSCPICLQSFGLREQVLTSCSHTFHSSCLNNMERFMGTRCCPCCRAEGYQRRRTRQGAYRHVQSCVVRVQSVWRGHACRTRYFTLRKRHYLEGSGARDPGRRKAFLKELLGGLSGQVVADAVSRRSAVDALCGESDAAVAASRKVLEAAQARLNRQAGGQGAPAVAPVPAPSSPGRAGRGSVASLLDELAVRLLAAEARQEQLASTRAALAEARRQQERQAADARVAASQANATVPVLKPAEWRAVLTSAVARGHVHGDCPVCIMPMTTGKDGEKAGHKDEEHQECSLLSCGHVFHGVCIASFEVFNRGAGLAQQSQAGAGLAHQTLAEAGRAQQAQSKAKALPRCPLCRTAYCRVDITTTAASSEDG